MLLAIRASAPALTSAQATELVNLVTGASHQYVTPGAAVFSSNSFSGDVSGKYNATSVDKIKGTALSISALTSGNFLKYNGSAWVNTSLASGDITGALGYTPVNKAGDTMSGSLDLAGKNLTSIGTLSLKGSTSGTLTMTVPATVTSYSLKWPSAVAGLNVQVLASDTSGNLSWATVASAPAHPPIIWTCRMRPVAPSFVLWRKGILQHCICNLTEEPAIKTKS